MDTTEKTSISVETIVKAPIDKVWKFWTAPEHITKWNNASADWHTPRAVNDLRIGEKFVYRMEAKDGSEGFDFSGVYDTVEAKKRIEYTIGDGRKVRVDFVNIGDETQVRETFDAENENPVEMQQAGWQSILDNFKHYAESMQ
jgi:uncharacterized protein YndB with AHSA1/START domain